MAYDVIVAIDALYEDLCLPAMMGDGFKDDTVLHGSWRSRSFTMGRLLLISNTRFHAITDWALQTSYDEVVRR